MRESSWRVPASGALDLPLIGAIDVDLMREANLKVALGGERSSPSAGGRPFRLEANSARNARPSASSIWIAADSTPGAV